MRIVKNGDVHVSAPIGMPREKVMKFIEEHKDWINEARKKTYERQKQRAEFFNKLPLATRAQADEALKRAHYLALGSVQCERPQHLHLSLRPAVAGMVCRTRRGSRAMPPFRTQPQRSFPCPHGQVFSPLA